MAVSSVSPHHHLLLATALLLLTCARGALSAQRCPNCGTTPIPYPLSTGPTCGNQLYKLRCEAGSLLFETINNNYSVTSISPEIQRLTIQPSPFLPNTCITADLSTQGVQLNYSLPFSIASSNTILYLNCSDTLLSSPMNCTSSSICHTFINGTRNANDGAACGNSSEICCAFRAGASTTTYSLRLRDSGCRAYRSFVNLDASLPVSRWPQPGLELQWASPSEPICETQADCVSESLCVAGPGPGSDPTSGNWVQRCFCNPGFYWDAIAGVCEPTAVKAGGRGHGIFGVAPTAAGVATAAGVLFLIASVFALYKLLKRRRNRRIKVKFFKRNGGLLLQQQSSVDENVVQRTRIFSAKELDQASDQFNKNRILGRGGQGTVYKGMLSDGKIVAIKTSKMVDESQLEQFINEIVILSQVNHRNVVKLLGCCLETEVPLLVYEFIPNGTLSSLIHNQIDDKFPFTWDLRLRIACEVTGALAYLHSATSIPIYHRDVKSSNILLDERYIAKVSDFGISRSIATDKTHLTTLVKGTFGYLDPEYFQSSQFTEKSDVYSFGVVLVELLTRKKPISSSISEDDSHLNLATRFLMTMDENHLNSILDPQVLDQRIEEEVVGVAKLAQRCLNLEGKKRPTMMEVAIELENIKLSSNRSTIQANFESQEFTIEESVSLLSNANPSWTTGR